MIRSRERHVYLSPDAETLNTSRQRPSDPTRASILLTSQPPAPLQLQIAENKVQRSAWSDLRSDQIELERGLLGSFVGEDDDVVAIDSGDGAQGRLDRSTSCSSAMERLAELQITIGQVRL